ncbi:MAG: hypothetical protein JST08_04860 [Actinobacteria bacterium]|nr:hypothetical protein [Actinomycetota bacterium]
MSAIVTPTEPDAVELVREARQLVESVSDSVGSLRLLGGVAIAIHCGREENPHRQFSDADTVVGRRDVKALKRSLAEHGYEGDDRFNSLNGADRLIFKGGSLGKLDVFIDRFEMCHEIPLSDRLELDQPTLTVTDLLLTKLQVVEMNAKDFEDLVLLIETHEVRGGEGDQINADYLRSLLGRDWGLWKTVTLSIAKLREQAPQLDARLDDLEATTEGPRSFSWKLRARVGERSKWYEEPEEVEEG